MKAIVDIVRNIDFVIFDWEKIRIIDRISTKENWSIKSIKERKMMDFVILLTQGKTNNKYANLEITCSIAAPFSMDDGFGILAPCLAPALGFVKIVILFVDFLKFFLL